jgi:hypothetical protein
MLPSTIYMLLFKLSTSIPMLFGISMKACSHLSGAGKKPSGFLSVLKPSLLLFPFGSGFADVADIMIFFIKLFFLLNRERLLYMKEK